jgi:hypothetical protein
MPESLLLKIVHPVPQTINSLVEKVRKPVVKNAVSCSTNNQSSSGTGQKAYY